MKIAFVIHRYAADRSGGIERYCQLIAERMSKHWDIEILTTCARDFTTWKNEFPSGVDHINGIPVHRFPVDYERDPQTFRQLTDTVVGQQRVAASGQFEAWMRAQGPYSTPLFHYIEAGKNHYDAFFFFSYLYAATYYGLPLVLEKAFLVPAAHDEPMIRLPVYQKVFQQARFIFYNTLEERKLIRRICGQDQPGEITGVSPGALPIKADGSKPVAPYLIYIGRIDEPKGCGQLIGYFLNAPELTGLQLCLVGSKLIDIPSDPRIHSFGYLEESKKNWLLQNATALVMPSFYESLSLVLLEAWSLGVPALVNGRCEALKGQVDRSGGGLAYVDIRSFAEQALALASSPALRCTLGLRGQRYVGETYSWPKIEEKYLSALFALFAGQK